MAEAPSGFTPTPAHSAASLDLVRAPMFDWSAGRSLPPSGSANADDLQDLLSLYLDQCRASGGELFERELTDQSGPPNLATSTASLQGWTLVDRNDRTTVLDTEIPGGESTVIVLDGSGVQLGNDGGNLVLRDPHTTQIDSVTYSSQDAETPDRYVRFRR
ncbi:hypothetical protein [Nocardia aurea]|uniref:hypothetical protein n=1 Tax=Nocardia aurea TaxID=2144174 RepID=UPI002FCD72C3